jgi:hypothetical protein
MKCVYCNNIFSTKTNLNNHQKRAKYCLDLRGVYNKENEYKCVACDRNFSGKYELSRHSSMCKKNDILINTNKKITKLENKVETLEVIIKELRADKKDLQDRYDNLSITAVSRNFEDETTIDIDDTIYSPKDYGSDEDKEEYQLTPLEVGQGFTIEHREEDGYINVTNLCKAGGKLFKNWKKTQKTKAFLQVLNSVVPFGTTELIKLGTGSKNIKNSTQGTWVHPQVAINIAQWISPQFDVKVSGWVYEIMMTGKVDITNTTSFKQLQKDNKDKQIKIQYLTKKYVKAQPRVQYDERNVVYILTTKRMRKDRIYILGKATNLTNRLSTYNKSDEHKVMYYQGCGDEETMSLVETMVFKYLKDYREQANRERFVLPEEKEITLFSDIIKKSVEFFKK